MPVFGQSPKREENIYINLNNTGILVYYKKGFFPNFPT